VTLFGSDVTVAVRLSSSIEIVRLFFHPILIGCYI